MSLLNILEQIERDGNQPNSNQIDQVAQNINAADLRNAVAAALGADNEPSLKDKIGELFEKATPEERAGILSALADKMQGGQLSDVAGGALAGSEGEEAPDITPAQAGGVLADHVRDIVNRAQQNGPGVVDKVSDLYAQHPNLLKTLGSGALLVALAHMKRNLKK